MDKAKRILAAAIGFAICTVLMCPVFFAGGTGFVYGDDEYYVAGSEDIFKENYIFGETVEIPERTITYNGSELKAVAYVTTPSQVTLRTDSVTLSETGKYVVTYIADTGNGNSVYREYSFTSAENLYSVTSSLSSVSYGHSLQNYDITRDVLLASVSSRDRFEYAPIIDLNELGGNEFIEFFVTPENVGTADATKIQIVLTDAYDEDNFVTISVKKGTAAEAGAAWAEVNSYIAANAVGQVSAGLESGYTGIVVNGKDYRLQKGNAWGANVRFALPGNPGYVSVSNPNNDPDRVATQSLKFSLDNETGEIYANGQLVTVLKNSDIYDSEIWPGFTTGECYLSIYGESFNSASLGLGIISMGGRSFADGEVENIFIDETAPEISIDVEDESATPKAVAGRKYKIFDAEAVDDYSGVCSVDSTVYYISESGGRIRISISDGYFVPIKEGTYEIIYNASDAFGNTAEKVVVVEADDSAASVLTAEIPDAGNGTAGVPYFVGEPEFSDARGQTYWYADIKLEGEEIVYHISSDDPFFVPEYAGNYVIEYTYGDYLVEITEGKTFTVSESDVPVIDGTPVLPKYFIYGCEYTLPELEGTIYSTGVPQRTSCEIYVSEDGGVERKINGKFITYAEEYVEIIYRLSDGEVSEIRSQKIPVVNVGYNGTYKIEKYFYGDDFTAFPNKDYIKFTADNATGGSAGMTFINALQTFDFSFRAYASGAGFNKLSVILTDSTDDSVSVKFTYRNDSGAVYFSINDGQEQVLSSAIFNSSDSPLYLTYDGMSNMVSPVGLSTTVFEVTNDMNGNVFNGFAEMSAYMTIVIEDISRPETASVNIVSINNQRISGIYTDNVKPQISAATASGDRKQGSSYTISKVYVADVLDVVTGYICVTAPDGSYVVADDGTVLSEGSSISRDYTFALKQFGAYSVSYTVEDICGNKLTYGYVLRSSDFTKPEIQINSPVTQGSVGSQVRVAEITVTDNKDEDISDMTVFVMVTTPDFRSHSLTYSDGSIASTFTASYAGEYTITYIVIDSSGNMAMASYVVNIV